MVFTEAQIFQVSSMHPAKLNYHLIYHCFNFLFQYTMIIMINYFITDEWKRKRSSFYPAGIYILKVNNRDRAKYEICSELTIKTRE